MNSAFFVEDNQGHVHNCKPLVQKRYSYMPYVDFGIEVVWKAILKYIECKMGWIAIPSVVECESVHG